MRTWASQVVSSPETVIVRDTTRCSSLKQRHGIFGRETVSSMNELLALAVKAHGGLERWTKVKSVKVAASIVGAIWFVKSKGDACYNTLSVCSSIDLTAMWP
jgi:hypothetical protein